MPVLGLALGVELDLTAGECRHGRQHARNVADVIGAKHVDHVGKAALQLVVVISDVAGEIGVAAV